MAKRSLKESARGGRRNEAAVRNGKVVGRPPSVKNPLRFTVTLDQSTVDILKAISSNISTAIRELARRSKE